MQGSARSRSSLGRAGGWLLAALLVLAGCDEDSPSPRADAGADDAGGTDGAPGADADAASDAAVPPGEGGEPEPGDLEADFCAPLATYLCNEAADCGCGALVPAGELDRTGCIARWTQKCLGSYGSFVAAVDSGLARVSTERARACVALIEQRTPDCEHARGTIPFALCTPFVVSDEPLDDACAGFPWCAGGEGVCSESTCVARGQAGDPCGNEASCATPLACLGGTCTALGTVGADCQVNEACVPELRCVAGQCSELGVVNDDCSEQAACARGLVCDGAPAGKCKQRTMLACAGNAECGSLEQCGARRLCSVRRGANEPCVSERDCTPELYCGAEGSCLARPGLGEPCGNGVSCAVGLGCDPSGVADPECIALPGDGEPCANGASGPLLCAEGLACSDGNCAPLPGEAEPCSSDSRCQAGLACDFTPEGSFCVKPKALGEPCQNDVVCGATAHCGPSGGCEADQPDGTLCSAGNECSGVCTGDDTGGFSCQPARAEGDSCLFDDECPDTTSCQTPAGSGRCFPEVCGDL
jgi:hypothetical protein